MKIGNKVRVIQSCPIIGDALVGYEGIVVHIDNTDDSRTDSIEESWNIYVNLDIDGEIEESVPFPEHELEVINE